MIKVLACKSARLQQEPLMVHQVPEHGFDSTLPDPPHALAPAALLALPRPAVWGIVEGAGELLALGPRHASGFQWALLAVRAVGPVNFEPVAVGRGVVLAKGQRLARPAMVDVPRGIVSEAVDLNLVLAKDGDPSRNVPGFEQGVIRAVGVAGVRQQVAHAQLVGP